MTKSDEDAQLRREYAQAVNMTPAELRQWLRSDESKAVGQKSDPQNESTGHSSGRHILRIAETKVADYSDADYAHMKKVVGYVRRLLAQRPKGDVESSTWRYSLMNWGHDPQKE